AESEAVLVSLTGGPDLTMSEVHRVMEQINNKVERAQVIMGAAINESFRERLAITLVASRRAESLVAQAGLDETAHAEATQTDMTGTADELINQLVNRTKTPRPRSRFVPPPPAMSQETIQQLVRPKTEPPRARRGAAR